MSGGSDFAPAAWRPASLAREAAGAGAWRAVLAGLVAFLLALEAIAVASLAPLATRLLERASGSATVAVWGAGLESADAAAARAADGLSRQGGVQAVRPLDPRDEDKMVATAIAAAPRAADPEPRLLRVDARPGRHLTAAQLNAFLTREGIAGAADAHDPSTSALWRAAATVLAAAGGGALGLLLVGAWTAASAGRRSLRRSAGLFDLLLVTGADDGFLLRLFGGKTFAALLAASLAGVGAAAALAVAERLIPDFGVGLAGWTAPAPPALGLAAAAAALAALACAALAPLAVGEALKKGP